MASVSKRKGTGDWVVRYTGLDGRRHLLTCTGKKQADAERRRIETEIEMRVHTPARSTVTLAFAVDQWLRDCDRRWKIKDGIAGYTLKNYTNMGMRHVVPSLGAIKVTKLTWLEIQEFLNERAATHAPKTVSAMKCALALTLQFAISRGWLARNPLADRNVRVPTGYRKPRDIPNQDEIDRILKAARTWRKFEGAASHFSRGLIVLLALRAGLRRGEISGLQWRDLDFVGDNIRVRHSYSSRDGLKNPKSDRERDVPIAPDLRAALLEHARRINGGASGFVLTGKTGNRILPHHLSVFYLKPVMQTAGLLEANGTLKYSLHRLRHTCITHWRRHLGLSMASKLAGHSSVAITADVYDHIGDEDVTMIRRVMARISGSDGTHSVEPPSPIERPAIAPPTMTASPGPAMPDWEGASEPYSPITLRAYRTDWDDWVGWCDRNGLRALPAQNEPLRRYLTELAASGHKVSTRRRRVTAIAYAHKLAGQPFDSEGAIDIRRSVLEPKAPARRLPTRQASDNGAQVIDLPATNY